MPVRFFAQSTVNVFVGLVLVASLAALPGRTMGRDLDNSLPANRIPPAAKPCSTEEAAWWQAVRAAGAEAAASKTRRRQAESRPNVELAQLDAQVISTTMNYLRLLREGADLSFSPPIPDGRAVVLFSQPARYSEAARAAGISGTVVLDIELRADGTVGEMQVIRGLETSLDRKCMEAARTWLFVPAVRDGKFVSTRRMAEFSFTLY